MINNEDAVGLILYIESKLDIQFNYKEINHNYELEILFKEQLPDTKTIEFFYFCSGRYNELKSNNYKEYRLKTVLFMKKLAYIFTFLKRDCTQYLGLKDAKELFEKYDEK